ncbi:MAG: hypothetical protein L6R36_005781 [Xanthoria steineri]|nr:MAG: hypothetical protein L6R36_005781 [Xanthoria steineri]
MPQATLYKWEKNSGLDHKCGICKTVLSSPRAKKTCFGVHEEVTRTNAMRRCRKSAELHDKRHRGIASLVLRIKSLDNDEAVLSSVPNGKPRHRKRDILELEYFQDSQAPERTGEKDEWADTSTTPTLNDDGLERERAGIPDIRENYAPRRMSKAIRKQARHSKLLRVVTPVLMEKIHATLHPESQSLEDMSDRLGDGNDAALSQQIIDDNLSYNTACFKPASTRQSVHTKKLLKANGTAKIWSKVPQNEGPEMAAILEQLDIMPVSTRPSKERVALLKHLRSSIRDDINKVENENRDTMMRMAGYWRYVNRKTYNFMVRNNQIWDWATGQKLEEIEEEEEESELDAEVGPWDDASTIGTSRSGAGTPQKDVRDNQSDIHFGDTDSCKAIGTISEQDTISKSTLEAHRSRPRAAESSTRNHRPFATPERPGSPFIALEKDLRHYEIPATVATHKFEERVPPTCPLPTSPTSKPSSSDRKSFSPPHHDPSNRYDLLESLKGGLNRPLGHTNSIKVLKVPSRSGTVDTANSWTTVKRQGSRSGKPTYADTLKKRT